MNIEISPKEYEKELNWNDSNLYCESLVIDGKDDWTMPTKEELDYIYHSENDFDKDYYWSSTEYDGDCNYAWVEYFTKGIQGYLTKFASLYVRPIRTIE